MVDIDERVVQMKFDSSQFEQKSKSTLSILDKLHEKLSFKDAVNEDSVNSVVDNVEKIATKSFTIVDRVIDKIHDNIANKIVNFLQENTIGQFQSGWKKYADMTTSVATLKSQGYAMEQITDQLERLNYFTDETSYKFTDMVTEIGKFTASGQSLEDATTAMMGIANWAALSGKNANDASRAMYQLSQALGAGQMRLQDYKSVQNLNMDTKEFRQNAIEAAIAVGTLKDNLDGTYTSLVNSKVSFSIQNFAESLTQGKWFNSEVMMKTYKKYSEAVDEIRNIYETKTFFDAENNAIKLNTTADAVEAVKQNNEYLIKKFQKTELDSTSVSKLLNKWKNVEKVTARTVEEYAEMHEISVDQAKLQMEEQQKNYAEYLKEYAETFTDAEESAEEALEKWHTYVSEYGIKAFLSAQEAKTFTDAIESAKDAASTVWTTIYTNVFGNYEEAKEIWTDLANALYEIFVERLWSLNDIFEYWKTGGRSAMEAELKEYENELNRLKKKSLKTTEDAQRISFLQGKIADLNDEINAIVVDGERTTTTALQKILDDYGNELVKLREKTDPTLADQERMKFLSEEITRLNDQMENTVFVNGRTMMFQGIYAFGSGLKSIILNFREGWDSLFEDNASGKALISFSERLRASGFQFYTMMKKLGESDFYKNIAQSIHNILSPLKAIVTIIKSVISQFLPKGDDTVSTLVKISEWIRDLTSKLVVSEGTISKIAKVLRGAVAIVKFIGKVLLAIYKTIVKPVLETAYNVLSSIVDNILAIGAAIGDVIFQFEESVSPMEALGEVGEVLSNILGGLLHVIGSIVVAIVKFLAPAFITAKNAAGKLIDKVKRFFGGSGGGNILENISDGFKDVGNRIKTAWTEGENLADVFNRFKGGSGFSNFIQMIGAMLENLIGRIGRTIAAMMGLDDELANTKIGEGIQNAKDIIVQAFAVIKWLYTNIIKPTLSMLFEGVSALLKNIGDAFRSGDVTYFLTGLKNIFKTIGALEIVKLIKTITKIFSSGGLLKVLRNGAKALKGVYKYFSAKATNEMAGGLMKMAIALAIVVATMTALTFLPQDKLATLGKLLMHAGIAFAVMFAGIAGLGVMMKTLNNPLSGITAMFWAMVIAMVTTIAVIKLMSKAFDGFWKTSEDGSEKVFQWGKMFEAIGAALLPILAVFGTLLLISFLANKLGAGATMKNFAIGVAAIGVAVAALALGLSFLIDFVQSVSFEEGAAAVLAMVALIAVMTLAGIAMSKFTSTIGNWKSGLAVAIAMVAMVLSVALVVIPCLEDMVQNRDKFPQYAEAMGIFALTMLAISASMFLMTVGTKNGLHILLAGLVFNNVVKLIKGFLIPMLIEIQQIDFNSALSGILAIATLVVAIGGGIRLVIDGIANLIKAISKINWKSWAAIIVSTGLMIGLIMTLCYVFEGAGVELSLASILAPLGIIVTICIAFGLFAKMLSRILGQGTQTRTNIIKVFNTILAIVAVIAGSIILLVAEVGILFKDNPITAIVLIGVFAASLSAVMIVMVSAFSKLIKNLVKEIGGLNLTKFERVVKILNIIRNFLLIIMGGFLLTIVATGILYDNPLGMLVPLVSMTLAMTLGLHYMFKAVMDLIKSVIANTVGLTKAKFDKLVQVLNLVLTMISVIMGIIGASVAVIGLTYSGGYQWMSIFSAISIVGTAIGVIYAATKSFKEISKIVESKAFTAAVYKKFLVVLGVLGAYIILVTITMAGAISGVPQNWGTNLANALIIIGTVVFTTFAMVMLFERVLKALPENWNKNDLIALGMVFFAMILVITQISGFFTKIKEYEVLKWETGLSFAIAVGVFLVALGHAFNVILSAIHFIPTNQIEFMGHLAILLSGMGAVIFAAGMMIGQMDSLKDVDWKTVLAALVGLSLLVVAFSKTVDVMLKSSTFQGGNLNALFVNTLSMFAMLAGIAIFAPFIFRAFKELEGVEWGTIFKGLTIILVPFAAFFAMVTFATTSKVGDLFLITAAKIAAGIALIAAAALLVAGAIYLIREMFNLGEESAEAYEKGFNKEAGIKSPSKKMAKDGKYLVQGLSMGIKKNGKLAVNAAKGLAIYTNEGFCDELGIASPSKVFYENGRFVVRGFIDGVNSQANKNKQAGADMASGFGEGMEDVMGGVTEKWKGLWSEFGMDADIEKAMENGTANLPGILENSIFGETGEALTEEEEKELKLLEEKVTRMGANLPEIDASRLLELQTKKSKAGQNKLTGQLGDSFSTALNGAIGGVDLSGGLSKVKDTVLGFLGGNELTDSITGVFTGSTSGEGVIDKVTKAIDTKFGTNLSSPDGLSKTISNLSKNGNIKSAASQLGSELGGSIIQGIKDSIGIGDWIYNNIVDPVMTTIVGVNGVHGIHEYRRRANKDIIDYLRGMSQSEETMKFINLLEDSLKDEDGNMTRYMLTIDKVQEMMTQYQEIIKNGGTIDKIVLHGEENRNLVEEWTSPGYIEDFKLTYNLPAESIGVNGETYNWNQIEKSLADLFGKEYFTERFGQVNYDSAYLHNIAKQAIRSGIIVANKNAKNGFGFEYSQAVTDPNAKGAYATFVSWINSGAYKYYDEQVERDKQLTDSVNNRLSQEGYEKYGHFSTNDIEKIRDEADDLGLLDIENGALKITGDTNQDDINQIISLIQDITNNGLKINENGKDTRNTYARAQEIDAKLKEARLANDTSQIASWSAAKTNLEKEAYADYKNVLAIMQSKEYQYMGAPGQKFYQEKKKFYEEMYNFGKTAIDYNVDGMTNGVEENGDDIEELGSDGISGRLQSGSDRADKRKSPSKWWYQAGVFNVMGFEKGISDESKVMLKKAEKIFEDTQDTVGDITPTIAPIWEDDYGNSYTVDYEVPKSVKANFEKMFEEYKNPTESTSRSIEATSSSFNSNIPDYSLPLASLSDQIATLTTAVENFRDMVENGDIININVSGEVDTNNLYKLIIDTNRQRFKQTGKNQLVY